MLAYNQTKQLFRWIRSNGSSTLPRPHSAGGRGLTEAGRVGIHLEETSSRASV